ncbi:MAG: ABC transporter ATP-binding protein [Planctomycetota bacterium]|nr:ABC transporter ATP-binding protein [Planctomycetota bacterium]
MAVLVAEHISKTFGTEIASAVGVQAVRDVAFTVEQGTFLAITGASGSGKSTVLHMLGGITRPTQGRVVLEGVDLAQLDDEQLALLRRRRIGFVFQRYNLLPELSLAENVALPLELDGMPRSACRDAALAALEQVGMGHRADHRPDSVSGGEQQRAAIARALVTRPAILLADEPTGALDTANSEIVIELLQKLVVDDSQTVVLVTHDSSVAAAATRVIRMRDGQIESDTSGPHAAEVVRS